MRPNLLIPISHLTYREIEIVQLIRMGYSTKEMANNLGLSYFTVKKHRENILLKVGARGKTEFRKFVFEYELSPKQAE
ncbi:MAG: hypothetical protein RLZ73_1662 [Bacteroidota bacterium]|uniref:Helix-turn-helix transcriptional regulator n=1 Tax=Aquirufa novilacunae TaxID=3139305 RepID=A0ABW8SYJ5_9BACT